MLPPRFFRSRGFSPPTPRPSRCSSGRSARLPAQPVLPDRTGPRPAGGRSSDAAVDGDADARRAARRHPERPDRLAPAHGRRPRAAVRRDLLAWGGRARPTPPTASSSCPSRWRGSGWRSSSPPAQNAVPSPLRQTEAGQASGVTNAIREVGGVMGVAVLAGVFVANGGYPTRRRSATASAPRCRSARPSLPRVPWRPCWCRGAGGPRPRRWRSGRRWSRARPDSGGAGRGVDSCAVSRLPLDDLKVLDLTAARAGPQCVRQLSDWGADAIRVEPPDRRPTDMGDRRNSDFQNLHRNKRSLTLDLKSDAGRACSCASRSAPTWWSRTCAPRSSTASASTTTRSAR